MTNNKSGKTSLIIGFVLILILTIAIASMVYVFFCVKFGNTNGDMVIEYDKLQTVMADDAIYLSQDFAVDNSLEIAPIYDNGYFDESEGYYVNGKKYLGDVVLEYNVNKVSLKADFNSRVKNIDLYRYELIGVFDGIPVRVSVVGAPGNNKAYSYDKSIDGSGFFYAELDNELATYFTGVGKSYEIKAQVGKSGLIKKYARLKITVSVDAEYVSNYTLEQIEESVDKLLNSALNYVELYN